MTEQIPNTKNPKEIPVLFSTPMVQAILDGRKTETRREIKSGMDISQMQFRDLLFSSNAKVGLQAFFSDDKTPDNWWGIKCRWQKGDVLWVREKFGFYQNQKAAGLKFRTDVEANSGFYKWYPSIHMPKTAARIWLEVIDVRCERLQDITEESAIAEGIGYDASVYPPRIYNYFKKEWQTGGFPSAAFAGLWQSINGEESWRANPWVWVIKFKVLSTTGKPAAL